MLQQQNSPRAMVVVWLVVAGLAASLVGASPTSHGFDKAFHDFLYQHEYMGGAVAAIKDGRLLFADGFGKDRAGKQVTAHSKFHISSLAKSLTGVAIMRLVQEGRITLDDRVCTHFYHYKHLH
ncbi:beta-lactamase [Plakobranchus ocellatus]|uniref:Beta-lactamase n=1 Tax=Plakobranchus ocellatus TaxID=259542 RepID=A0AAV3XKC7_9GAST|nr:beta-lactamase [Plakobranchus ocellatus]